MNSNQKGIHVYSEIGKLKEVLVHRPGRELDFLDPTRLDELLFAATLEAETARLEHDNFTNALKNQGVTVIELADLVAQTYSSSTPTIKAAFINKYLDEATPALTTKLRTLVKDFLTKQKSVRKMVDYMIGGILSTDLNIKGKPELIVEPMPNAYFTRDPFASVGNGVTLHYTKHNVRRREVLFSEFIFNNNERFQNTPRYIVPTKGLDIEGGDVFVYNKNTLVVGVSERTKMVTIKELAKNILKNKECLFKKIYAINVPKMPNLMHLDTWLTMLDHNKFLYSPNMLSVLKIWEIDISSGKSISSPKELNMDLSKALSIIIGKKPILIPVAGENASQIDINIETNFDATNYLVTQPGVVVGYSRNKKTEAALIKAGIEVIPFQGNQLSLGMGSARCMSMPLIREDV